MTSFLCIMDIITYDRNTLISIGLQFTLLPQILTLDLSEILRSNKGCYQNEGHERNEPASGTCWVNPTVPDHASQPAEFFSVFRMDRIMESGKPRGDGKHQLVQQHEHCTFFMLLFTQQGAPDHQMSPFLPYSEILFGHRQWHLHFTSGRPGHCFMRDTWAPHSVLNTALWHCAHCAGWPQTFCDKLVPAYYLPHSVYKL